METLPQRMMIVCQVLMQTSTSEQGFNQRNFRHEQTLIKNICQHNNPHTQYKHSYTRAYMHIIHNSHMCTHNSHMCTHNSHMCTHKDTHTHSHEMFSQDGWQFKQSRAQPKSTSGCYSYYRHRSNTQSIKL